MSSIWVCIMKSFIIPSVIKYRHLFKPVMFHVLLNEPTSVIDTLKLSAKVVDTCFMLILKGSWWIRTCCREVQRVWILQTTIHCALHPHQHQGGCIQEEIYALIRPCYEKVCKVPSQAYPIDPSQWSRKPLQAWPSVPSQVFYFNCLTKFSGQVGPNPHAAPAAVCPITGKSGPNPHEPTSDTQSVCPVTGYSGATCTHRPTGKTGPNPHSTETTTSQLPSSCPFSPQYKPTTEDPGLPACSQQ